MTQQMKENRWNRYLLHLHRLVLPHYGGEPDDTTLFLFRELDNIPFEVLVDMDENRVYDAMNMRAQAGLLDDRGVSLLEILVELSYYMAFARENLVRDSSMERWFFEMLRNAGLDEFSSVEEIQRAGKRIVRREYDENGVGGLFPMVKTTRMDQREVELWMQMQEYLIQRYRA